MRFFRNLLRFTSNGSLDGFFEHPAWCTRIIPDVQTNESPVCPEQFLQPVRPPEPEDFPGRQNLSTLFLCPLVEFSS